mmetsp:Transcript_9588/g.8256  ORF Transcript_9588/g.8256 Transcript_9588/m.8256 type:complete len:80 (+) Transcript_9588:645-884(+)
MCNELYSSKLGLFRVCANKTGLEPDPTANIIPYSEKLFEFGGIILAKAIMDGHSFGVSFCRSFLKHILGIPIAISDLED